MTQALRIATRESRLALWQAEHVAACLRTAHPQLEVVLVPMTTTGDQVLDRTLAQVGGKGLFVKELELALSDGRADLAVHSMKDVPSVLPEGMVITSMLTRADPRDAFVSNHYANFAALPRNAHLGTASLRRQSQLLALRPDLRVSPIRGNVETRLRKLNDTPFDAIVLASAGLTRLGLAERITDYLDPTQCVPAAGQGVIGIECRQGDDAVQAFCVPLNDAAAADCVLAERACAARLEGSCQAPIAAYATLHGDELQLTGLVAATDGSLIIRDQIHGPRAQHEFLGRQLAERLLTRGADRLLAALRA